MRKVDPKNAIHGIIFDIMHAINTGQDEYELLCTLEKRIHNLRTYMEQEAKYNRNEVLTP